MQIKKTPTTRGAAGDLTKHLDRHCTANQLKNQPVHRHAGFRGSHEFNTGTRNLGTPTGEGERGLNFQVSGHQHAGIIAPGANHAKDVAAATLAEKRVFSRPEFMSLGLGVSIPQGRQHGDIHVITPSPIRLSNQQASGCQSHVGANQMATANSTPTPTSGTSTHDHTSLSFVKVEYKGPRKQRLTDWFAVPDEDYCTGNATGYRVAAELMSWVQSRPATYDTGLIVREIMAAAFAVLAEPHTQGKTDRRGSAVTFLESMAGFIQFAAQHSNHQTYLAGKAQQSEDWAKKSAQMEIERNRETGLRLAAARAAKRAARMAGSGRAA